MKKKFAWGWITNAETDAVWKNAIVTVDANVLLDLYRMDPNAYGALLTELERVKGRIWLSDMAGKEFFHKRLKVIADVVVTFESALTDLNGYNPAIIKTLTNHRGVAQAVVDELKASFTAAMKVAIEEIEEAKVSRPNYGDNDAVLQRILNLFEGAVGPAFTPEDRAKFLKEAAARKVNRLQPGLTDDVTTGDLAYGDFAIWKQILAHAANEQKPVIFITSEKKPDWFAGKKDKLEGPNLDLIREAWEETGQRVLILQTQDFLRESQERNKVPVNEDAVSEIRNIGLIGQAALQMNRSYEEYQEIGGAIVQEMAELRHNLNILQQMSHSTFPSPEIKEEIERTTRRISVLESALDLHIRTGHSWMEIKDRPSLTRSQLPSLFGDE